MRPSPTSRQGSASRGLCPLPQHHPVINPGVELAAQEADEAEQDAHDDQGQELHLLAEVGGEEVAGEQAEQDDQHIGGQKHQQAGDGAGAGEDGEGHFLR